MANVLSSADITGVHQDLSFGERLREWRQRRRLSQLELAAEADLSTRHLSFVETGRARPSREMVQRLSETLDLPLRSRNALLVSAGFAPSYPERSFDDAAFKAARAVVQQILDAHMPFPSLAVDRHWHLVAHNAAVPMLMAGAAPHLVEPPVNVLRLSLHPQGLAPAIANLAEWKRHILDRRRHQIAQSGDERLETLYEELLLLPHRYGDRGPAAAARGFLIPSLIRHFALERRACQGAPWTRATEDLSSSSPEWRGCWRTTHPLSPSPEPRPTWLASAKWRSSTLVRTCPSI